VGFQEFALLAAPPLIKSTRLRAQRLQKELSALIKIQSQCLLDLSPLICNAEGLITQGEALIRLRRVFATLALRSTATAAPTLRNVPAGIASARQTFAKALSFTISAFLARPIRARLEAIA